MVPGDRKPSTQQTWCCCGGFTTLPINLIVCSVSARDTRNTLAISLWWTFVQLLCIFKECSVPPTPLLKVVGGDNVPDDGSDVGIKLGHQDTRPHNEDVQRQNMEEAEGKTQNFR